MKRSFEGRLERVENGEVFGWIWDTDHPSLTVFLEIFVDDIHVCSAAASEFRLDLAKAGKGTGHCGFRVMLPSWVLDDKPHVLHTRVAGDPSQSFGTLTTQLLRNIDLTDPLRALQYLSKPTVFYAALSNPSVAARERVPSAIVGKEDWLFLDSDSNGLRDQLCGAISLSPQWIEKYQLVLRTREQQLSKLGIPYFFAVAPTKEVVYPEYLPHGYVLDESNFPSDKIQTALIRNGINVVDIKQALTSSKSMGKLYHRTDTHWNDTGGYLAYRAILTSVKKFLRDLPIIDSEECVSESVPGFRGDLARKKKVGFVGGRRGTIPFDENAFDPDAFVEVVTTIRPSEASGVRAGYVEPYLQVSDTRPTVVMENVDSTLPRAVVFHDSFGSSLVHFFAASFSRVVFVWRPEMLLDIVVQERPDVVIQIVADRFMLRLPQH